MAKSKILVYKEDDDHKIVHVHTQEIDHEPIVGDYFLLGKGGELPVMVVGRFWSKGRLHVITSSVSGVPDYMMDAMSRY